MASFTIRQKSSKTPIMTMGPKLLELVMKARPESVALALGKYSRDYKSITGKNIHIDHEQTLMLMKKNGADENGMWTSKYSMHPKFRVIKAFEDGLMQASLSQIEQTLETAEAFFDLIDLADKAANDLR